LFALGILNTNDTNIKIPLCARQEARVIKAARDIAARYTVKAADDSIQKGGSIVIVGVFGEKPRMNLARVQDRELNLHGTVMYWCPDYQYAVELIVSGGIPALELLLTNRRLSI
jgi:threonine dehydrogenase-like Zn-dependent dehydrogenase